MALCSSYHFISVVFDNSSKTWYYCSDSNCYKIKDFTSEINNSTTVSLLVYGRSNYKQNQINKTTNIQNNENVETSNSLISNNNNEIKDNNENIKKEEMEFENYSIQAIQTDLSIIESKIKNSSASKELITLFDKFNRP